MHGHGELQGGGGAPHNVCQLWALWIGRAGAAAAAAAAAAGAGATTDGPPAGGHGEAHPMTVAASPEVQLFSQHLWGLVRYVFEAILAHPFLVGLVDGTLAEETFRWVHCPRCEVGMLVMILRYRVSPLLQVLPDAGRSLPARLCSGPRAGGQQGAAGGLDRLLLQLCPGDIRGGGGLPCGERGLGM